MKNKIKIKKPTIYLNYKLLPEVIVISVLLILLFNFLFESKILQSDSYYYLKISEALRLSGQENTHHFKNVYDSNFKGIEAYHFFEMWLGALIMQLFDKVETTFILFRVICQSVIMLTVIIGLFAIAESITQKPTLLVKIFIVMFCLFFFPNNTFPFQKLINMFHFPVESNPIIRPNFRTYWLFLIPPVYFLINNKTDNFFISILILPIISITTAPAIYACVFLIIILSFKIKFLKESVNVKQAFFLLMINAIALVLLLSIFKIQKVTPYYQVKLETIIHYYKATYKAIIFMVANLSLHTVILYLPFFLIMTAFLWKESRSFIVNNKFVLTFSILMVMCGIGGFQIMSFMSNTYQFAFIGYVTLCLLLLIFIIYLSKENPKRSGILICCFIAFMFYSAWSQTTLTRRTLFENDQLNNETLYSSEYVNKVDSFFHSHSVTPAGGYIADSTYYEKKTYAWRMPDVYALPLGYYISAHYSYSYEFCLSTEKDILYKLKDGEANVAYLQFYNKSTVFNRFVLDKTNENKDYATLLKEFINKFKIKYLILTDHTEVDEGIIDIIKEKITDTKTNEKFLILN